MEFEKGEDIESMSLAFSIRKCPHTHTPKQRNYLKVFFPALDNDIEITIPPTTDRPACNTGIFAFTKDTPLFLVSIKATATGALPHPMTPSSLGHLAANSIDEHST